MLDNEPAHAFLQTLRGKKFAKLDAIRNLCKSYRHYDQKMMEVAKQNNIKYDKLNDEDHFFQNSIIQELKVVNETINCTCSDCLITRKYIDMVSKENKVG